MGLQRSWALPLLGPFPKAWGFSPGAPAVAPLLQSPDPKASLRTKLESISSFSIHFLPHFPKPSSWEGMTTSCTGALIDLNQSGLVRNGYKL